MAENLQSQQIEQFEAEKPLLPQPEVDPQEAIDTISDWNIDELITKKMDEMVEKIKNNNLVDLSNDYFNAFAQQNFTIENWNIWKVSFNISRITEYVDGVKINKIWQIRIKQEKDSIESHITIRKWALPESFQFSLIPKAWFKETTQQEFMWMKNILLNARPNYDPQWKCFYNDTIKSDDIYKMFKEIDQELDKEINNKTQKHD